MSPVLAPASRWIVRGPSVSTSVNDATGGRDGALTITVTRFLTAPSWPLIASTMYAVVVAGEAVGFCACGSFRPADGDQVKTVDGSSIVGFAASCVLWPATIVDGVAVGWMAHTLTVTEPLPCRPAASVTRTAYVVDAAGAASGASTAGSESVSLGDHAYVYGGSPPMA